MANCRLPHKEERDKNVVALYNEGKTAREIANLTGLSYSLTRNILFHNRNKLSERPIDRYNRNFKSNDDTIRSLCRRRLSYSEIARLTQCSRYTVQRVCQEMVLHSAITEEQKSLLRDLAKTDATMSDVIQITGLHQKVITKFLSEERLYLTEPEDIEDYVPPSNDPQYMDDLQLKPKHRARYMLVHRRKIEHAPLKYGKIYTDSIWGD